MRRLFFIIFTLLTTVVFSGKPSSYTPPKPPVADANRQIILLDPGHGGYDVGARIASCNEKALALSTALITRKYLKEKGYRVIMTRMRDVFIPLQQRTSIANKTKSHLFVSFHFNSAKSTDAHGIEIFYYDSKDKIRSNSSRRLARVVLNNMIERSKAKNRGVKGGNFHVIRETKMPAILIEGGFITNEDERNKLQDLNYRDTLARSIAEGINSYFSTPQ